ncbi:WSC-domain-containing protein [Peziza echinospora]|nr:WSC-domain-containing protein [Peziza echinospora]
MKSTVLSATLAVAYLSTFANAFWRLPCGGPVMVDRADPIVNPGKVAGHLHTIMGGNGFDFTMDYEQALNSTCSTCAVTKDLSNYWTPSLFYQAKNGSFFPVKQSGGALIYYLQRRGFDGEKLNAFPPGFRMLAGNPNVRSFKNTPEAKAVNFACLDYVNGGPETNGFPTKNCPNGLRTQVFFPSCWDGKNLDSPDHKSHMAYPSGVNSGSCPASHPVRFISIFYEVMWDVNEWKDKWVDGKWPFVLSNGDPTGYAFHGDFVNGWHVDVLQKAIDNCEDNSGDIKKCPYFEYFDSKIQDDCFLPPRVNEPRTGWIDKLPGCNAVTYGPADNVPQTGCGATTTIGEPEKYYSDMTAKGWDYFGCSLDNLDTRTLSLRNAQADMTIEKCIDYCVSKDQTFAGLEFGNECWCGNSVAADRQGNYKCRKPCAGNPGQICGDGQRLSVYKKGVKGPAPVSSVKPTATATTVKPTTTIKVASTSTAFIPVPTPVATSATSPISTTATATSTGTPTPGSDGFTVPAGWVAKGCHIDPVDPRALPEWGYWHEKIYTSGCITHCESRGFKFAGTEYAGQCFCGNEFKESPAPAAECDMKCEGDAKQTCGGPARLTVYAKA